VSFVTGQLLCCVLYWCLVQSFLHHSPNVIINQIKVRAVGWPHITSNEFMSVAMKQLHCLMCIMSRCTVLLKDGNFIGDALSSCKQQQFVSADVNFVPSFTKTYTPEPENVSVIHSRNIWNHGHVVNC